MRATNPQVPRKTYRRRCTRRRGSTVVVTMIFLSLFTTLAIAFSASTNLSLRQARNYQYAQIAQGSAETGLSYTIDVLRYVTIPASEAEADILLAVANMLASEMDGTANMGVGEITFDGTTVHTPPITIQATGETFQVQITDGDAGRVLVTVSGTWKGAVRRASMQLRPVTTVSPVFDYGIASKGKIVVGGTGTVLGVNDPSEADMFSATYGDPEAILIKGNCTLDGDISSANPDSFFTITGSPSIGGTTDPEEIMDHIHVGVGDPVFPEIDTSVFEPFATNVLDAGADTSGDTVLTNIRIPAGMNPTFSANVTINGVLFVEQPNDVQFTGNVSITGVIVTEDPGDGPSSDSQLKFAGSVTSQGVESLPEEPQFADLRQMPGTMMLAPGFDVTFTGSFSAINGAIAADSFSMSGDAGGIIRGPIIAYGDAEFELLGSSQVEIDRSYYGNELPGLKNPVQLVPDSDSYSEY